MKQDYTLLFIHSFRAGEYNYYQPRTRGAVEVYHDDQRYEYRKPDNVKDFKFWLSIVFDNGNGVRVTGKYPTYYVDSVT